ncbi:hypothetical protein OG21DRAFT_1492169 [Imleria badia]|nr:hypothetical protein OG21DRAFT_1492169 [Imleria badia]
MLDGSALPGETLSNDHTAHFPLSLPNYYDNQDLNTRIEELGDLQMEVDTHLDLDIAIDEPGDLLMNADMHDSEEEADWDQKFTETYQGCSEAYPGGSTFMQTF